MLKISESTVKTRLSRARTKLQGSYIHLGGERNGKKT
ncbi:hypothetical protein IHV12_04975 [Fictibacillus sp. 7GRE50]|nr:hypothetical protein [Fictibacillus sp. 7GRE50]